MTEDVAGYLRLGVRCVTDTGALFPDGGPYLIQGEDERAWIAPDIYAPPAFETYRANRDPAMEAILACGEHLPGW